MAQPGERQAPPAAAAPGGPGGSPPGPPMWQQLRYPTQIAFEAVMEQHPDLYGTAYFELPPWIRLGWPSEDLWRRAQPFAVAKKRWVDIAAAYPERAGVPEEAQDHYRCVRYWPDCFGDAMVDVDLQMAQGITLNDLTYGPGRHRVPWKVAATLRWIDDKAKEEFINQFIPRTHRDKIIATLSGKTGEEAKA